MTLYLISGHGAGDPGAGGNGYHEADMVRTISSRLKALGGSQVVELDKSINWYASGRVNADLKRQVGDNPVLEIHLDYSSSSAKGGHVIIKEGAKADAYDTKLANFLKSFFPGRSSVIVGRSNLANVNRAYANSINYRLMECCFITNSEDMKKLVSRMDEFCRGVLAAFNIGVAGWVESSKGWWYRNADGSYPKSKWVKLDAWYWFDAKGYAVHDCWKKLDGFWYWFGSDCRMKTGWVKLKGLWYYLNPKKDGNWTEGSARTGWVTYKGKKYYLRKKSDGGTECSMVTGKFTIDGKEYEFDANGAMV